LRRRAPSFLLWSAAAACAAAALGAAACGGTTGREGLALGLDAAADVAARDDATIDDDSGAFDVVIQYADRILPDVAAPAEGGREAGYPWPNCPPFIPVDQDGDPTELGMEFNQIPSAYNDAGAIVPAPDGSACAQYGWLGSTAIDECVTLTSTGLNMDDYLVFPPCNWVADAGLAAQGPGAGLSQYANCLSLYACIIDSGCGVVDPTTCLCADCDAAGPCAVQELAALQCPPSESVQNCAQNFYTNDPASAGYGGAALNLVFQNAGGNGCWTAGQDAGSD
jgi:hypothetical protein